jgi:hypothetical protein
MPGVIAVAALAAMLVSSTGCPDDLSTRPGGGTDRAWIELFTDQDWNDIPEGDGVVFAGTVRYAPADDQPSIVMRYNPYRLEGADGCMTDIYCGSSDVLSPFTGMVVEIEGRIVTLEVEGVQFVEIWPARIRPATAAGLI